jgi:alanine racemase
MPVGYGDGYPRELSNRGEVLIRGIRAPILGRVCMDMTVVDVTDVAGAVPGDEAVLIGTQGKERITVEDLTAAIQTTEHEITTRLTPRVPRVSPD